MRTDRRGLFLGGVAGVALLLAGLGCTPARDAGMSAAQAALVFVERHQVEAFAWTDGCELIAYERGVFSTRPGAADCELRVDIPGLRRAIDGEARSVSDGLRHEAEVAGGRLTSVTATFDEGRVTSATIKIGSDMYWYEPGYVSMREDDWYCPAEGIDEDWYVWKWEC